jgi:hypothetical protein
MSPEKENLLVSKYPEMFRSVYKSPQESLMCFGCECSDGWFAIINTACWLISSHLKGKDADFEWCQIKEKFGTLRLYPAGGYDEYTSGVISMAESISSVTCERCGNAGSRRGGGWIVTLCDACAEKEGRT